MVLRAFSVYDVAAELYGAPFFMASKAEAVRAFTTLVNDESTMPGRYPAQFKLVQLAEWDNESGAFDAQFVSFGLGTDYVVNKLVQLQEAKNGQA